jgi:CheY-like chemotaxis protein
VSAILIVDDDVELRTSMCEKLAAAGYQVHCASDGKEALERLAGVDGRCLVLLDLIMTGMNGWQFRAAQLSDERLARHPVVVMSATRTLEEAAIEADGLLAKPISLDPLLRAVMRYAGPPSNEFDEEPGTRPDGPNLIDAPDEITAAGIVHTAMKLDRDRGR